MNDKLEKLIYLDREFISTLYEHVSEDSPAAVITRTDGLKAGFALPLFNAGVSSVESKSYSLSANQMLEKLSDKLREYKNLSDKSLKYREESSIGWFYGSLTIQKIKTTRKSKSFTLIGKPPKKPKKSQEEVLSEETYWHLGNPGDKGLALITSDEYFVSGVNRFPDLTGSIINQLSLPVRALVRVYSAKTAFENWIAVPLVIWE